MCVCIRVYAFVLVCMCVRVCRALISVAPSPPWALQDQHLPTPRPVVADKLHKHHMHHTYLPLLTLLEEGMDF